MKTLKFKPHLCEQILSGEKTSTWRLFDDKELTQGDRIIFLNQETLEAIGDATLTHVIEKTLGTLEAADWEGHETYESEEEMYATYRTYYGNRVGPDSELKIIHFTFNPKT